MHPKQFARVEHAKGDEVVFMSEDHEPVSVFGDRTLSRYRAMALERLGPSCPIPNAPIPQDALRATLRRTLSGAPPREALVFVTCPVGVRAGEPVCFVTPGRRSARAVVPALVRPGHRFVASLRDDDGAAPGA